jgi:membrane-bound metal-dependent hydrolase YbcI (DUF457 family)
MPITPFHFGPGAALHSLAPHRISFLAFCAANVLVDVEPLYYMVKSQFPLHRFFHTYIGVSIVVFVVIAIFLAAKRINTAVPLPNLLSWKQLTPGAVSFGAALGGYSHILLDSFMHSDITPLAPFTSSNPLWLAVSLQSLHWFCLGSGILGLCAIGARSLSEKSKGGQT